MGKNIVPKGCTVQWIGLSGKGTAEVRMSCTRPGTSSFRNPVESFKDEYRSKKLRGVRVINHRGAHIAGASRVGFTVLPEHAICTRRGSNIDCRMSGGSKLPALAGYRRRG